MPSAEFWNELARAASGGMAPQEEREFWLGVRRNMLGLCNVIEKRYNVRVAEHSYAGSVARATGGQFP